VLLEKAVMDEAQQNLDRMTTLRETNAISQSELDLQLSLQRVAAARYQAAVNGVSEKVALIGVRRAALALARQQLEDAVIRAPFEGVVQQRQVAVGAYLQAGAPVVTLVRTNPLRFRAGVPERKSLGVNTGQKVTIQIEGSDEPLEAEVLRISPALDLSSRSLTIEADVPNPGGSMRSGVFAEAEIAVGVDAAALTLPASSVGEFAGVEKVWRVNNGRLEQQVVTTGRREEKRIEILSGLSEGDAVALDFQLGRQGLPVEVGKDISQHGDPGGHQGNT
jgi:RND family efflux transporter MFP subunit